MARPMGAFVETDVRRLAAVAHYIIARVDPSRLGATKLNKIIWYADLDYYRKTGQSLSGTHTYVRKDMGPVPNGIDSALDILKREGKITERSARVVSFDRREFIWTREPDITAFTAEQIDIITLCINRITPMSADKISKETHKDALWKELENGQPMPLGAGAVVFTRPSEKSLKWAQAAIRNS